MLRKQRFGDRIHRAGGILRAVMRIFAMISTGRLKLPRLKLPKTKSAMLICSTLQLLQETKKY